MTTCGRKLWFLRAVPALLCALAAGALAGSDHGATVAEARFVDRCLGRPQQALGLYERVIRERATGKVLGEAMYGKARALYLASHQARAEEVLEALVARRGERALHPWTKRAGRALDAMLAGRDPYARPTRGAGEFTLRRAKQPLLEVLQELRRRARVGIAFDDSIPEPWTVSVALRNLSFQRMVEQLVGRGMVRKVADGAYVIGEVASDESAFERIFDYADLDEREDRAVAGVLRTRRVNLSLPNVPLAEARDILQPVTGAPIVLGPGALAKGARIRMWVEDLPVDETLDMLVATIGATWHIGGGKIYIEERRRPEDEDD